MTDPAKTVVVVTCREPYVDEHTGTGIRTIQKAGGVVSALDPVLSQEGGQWIAWGSGDADFDDPEQGMRMVPPEAPAYELHRIRLSEEQVDGFYANYSNQGLWPLAHMLIERTHFSRRAWQVYREVNQKFAQTAARTAPQGARIFSHDYQLSLFPDNLRRLRTDLSITHFWHIPWPPLTIFRMCPQYQQILMGLLGADIVGFQTDSDAVNFLEAVEKAFHFPVDLHERTVRVDNRTVRVRIFPISVDYEGIRELVQTRRVARWAMGVRHRFDRLGQRLAICVDRADYTKGIQHRLQGMDAFFERYPQYRGTVTFLQVMAPTRTEVEEYRVLFDQLRDECAAFNHKWGKNGWQPLISVFHNVDRPRLMGLLRVADVALVSSLFDGMNLVAKEYIAAQIEKNGALVLSEATGAAEELAENAFLINPLDPEGIADTLALAFSTPLPERTRRMTALQDEIAAHDLRHWTESILAEMNHTEVEHHGTITLSG